MPKKRVPKRGLEKNMDKISITLPRDMLDYMDEIAEESDTSRSEVIRWVFRGLMRDEELEGQFFEEIEEEEESEEGD